MGFTVFFRKINGTSFDMDSSIIKGVKMEIWRKGEGWVDSILIYGRQIEMMETMRHLFTGENYEVLEADTLGGLYRLMSEQPPHLLLMGVEGSGGEGARIVQEVRKSSSIPIVVLTEHDDEMKKVEALEAGADDCISYQDCSPLELLARVKSRLRRYTRMADISEEKERIYRADDLMIDDSSKRVFVKEREVRLTPIEYEIVKLLVKEKGKVFSIGQIYEAIWHMKPIGADNTIAVHIHHIREKIEENPKEPQYIKAVWGTGYKAG